MDKTVLSEIERLAQRHSEHRAGLSDRVIALKAKIDALTREALPAIRSAVQMAADSRDALRAEIEAHPEAFERPRTRTLHGLRCGYMAGKAKIEIPDEAETLRRIRELLPAEQAELLIAVTERVDKRAVGELSAADLKRLRIRIEPGLDEVYIRPADSAVDKLVAALLKDAERLEQEAA
jgi:hypothetical protein